MTIFHSLLIVYSSTVCDAAVTRVYIENSLQQQRIKVSDMITFTMLSLCRSLPSILCR